MTVALWIIQSLLAALFLFAGAVKLVLPAEDLTGPIAMPILFLRFIGALEVLGALGLILPGLLRIRTGLTPLAALGLVIIMVGATVTTIVGGAILPSLISLAAGLLSAFVAYARWNQISREPQHTRRTYIAQISPHRRHCPNMNRRSPIRHFSNSAVPSVLAEAMSCRGGRLCCELSSNPPCVAHRCNLPQPDSANSLLSR